MAVEMPVVPVGTELYAEGEDDQPRSLAEFAEHLGISTRSTLFYSVDAEREELLARVLERFCEPLHD